jgi:hypothetical protein
MPKKETLQKAKQDKREGKAPSTQAGEFIKETIDEIRQGKHGARSTKQAIAIGLSKARRAGVDLPAPKKGKTSDRSRKNAPNALIAPASQNRTVRSIPDDPGPLRKHCSARDERRHLIRPCRVASDRTAGTKAVWCGTSKDRAKGGSNTSGSSKPGRAVGHCPKSCPHSSRAYGIMIASRQESLMRRFALR